MKKMVRALLAMSILPTVALADVPQQAMASTSPTMVLSVDPGSPLYTENWNPFSPNALWGQAWMYETLVYLDQETGKATPWLATAYKWASSTKLTFTIRKGVTWSNGTPFSAADVAFTFNLMHKYSALDGNGLWTVLKSVTASGDKVTFEFKRADVPAFTYIVNTPIVSEKIWSKVKNPVTFANLNPVGTGSYILKSYTPQEFVLVRNPHYWQANKVKVQTIDFPAVSENANTVWLNLSEGKYTAANAFAPNIQKIYLSKDPANRHIWFAPGGACNLLMNLDKYPFNNVKFRQAMAYAINRPEVSSKGEFGYEPVASMTGLMLPANSAYVDKALVKKYNYTYNPQKAAQLLASMGLHKNSQGQLVGAHGPISFNMTVPTGFSDWIEDVSIIQGDLKALGITVNMNTPSVSTWVNDMQTGHFDMTLNFGLNDYNPYFYYRSALASENSAPIGKTATSNYERYQNPKVDALLKKFSASTSTKQQHQVINQLQGVMLKQVPVIPMFYAANWNEYSTKDFVGWPSASNPYVVPTYAAPDVEMEFTHLRPKS